MNEIGPRSVLAAALIAFAPTGLVAQHGDTARAAQVDAVFAEWQRPGSPGGAVVVVRNGEIVYEAGYGTADLDHELPIGPGTVFEIASMSKQFTAFAVALLVEDGVLSLDDPVREWMPELPADVYDPVTLRHLVHHTGGVRDWVELLWLAGWRFDDVIAVADILELAKRQRALNFPPGSEERYSNTGYTLLAETVGRATGGTFREFMHERVFVPLGMKDTHVHDDHTEIVAHRARSYEPREGGGWMLLVDNTMGVGSGSVFTTVHDLAQWLRNLEEGTVGGSAVGARMRERFTLTGGDTIDYAFGLSHGEYRGLPTLGHGGSWRGYRTNLLTFPEQHLGIVVLGNSTAFD
ncbi:MAG: serine hydrolase domain-containing protein, partial [Longimicrobiales bacterium]